jgi:DNA-binding response OmpR family regulator
MMCSDAFTGDSPLVLVVDDDATTLETFRLFLSAEGYRVEVASDAETGLNVVDTDRPSAIVLDLHMPGADGVEFLRRLRTNRRHASVPVALVTGDYLIDEQLAHAVTARGARIFFKPLWEDDLLRIVTEMVSRDSNRPPTPPVNREVF